MGYLTGAFVTTSYGSGVHQWDVRMVRFITWAKVGYSQNNLKHEKSKTHIVGERDANLL